MKVVESGLKWYVCALFMLIVLGLYPEGALARQCGADSVAGCGPSGADGADSIRYGVVQPRFARFVDRVTSSSWFKVVGFGTPLIVDGLVIQGIDRHFRQLRNTYMPRFNTQ